MTEHRGFLWRLRRNRAGNVAYLTAGAIFPFLAVVGSGVDLGLAYMAKTRLQQACDAGVLAGRRVMAEGNYDSAARTAANDMFNFNYPEDIYRSSNLTFSSERSQTTPSEVNGTASVRVPTVLMHMFRKAHFDLTVDCTAKLEISNADIMFVLDTTGSMNCTPTQTSCDTSREQSGSKIGALRTEVMAFFDTLSTAQAGDGVIRYGAVPYSSNVNVGRLLRAANPDLLADDFTVPSRTGEWVTTRTGNTSTAWSDSSGFSSWTNTGNTMSGRNSSNCGNTTRNPQYVNGSISSGPTTSENATVSTSTSGQNSYGSGKTNTRSVTRTTDTFYNATKYRYNWSSSACREQQSSGIRRERVTRTDDERFDYTYSMITYDASALVSGGSITVPAGTMGADITATWGGCIMERETVSFPSNASSIPGGAWDLDIDTLPGGDDLRWRVWMPSITFPRSFGGWETQDPSPANFVSNRDWHSYAQGGNQSLGYAVCPSEAMRLTPLPPSQRSVLQNYVNGLVPVGGTYHDVGMVWGARFISPSGIFAADNASAPNGMPISRHIIFMTDGDMAPNPGIYGFQGQEFLHRRVGSTDTNGEMTDRHVARFLAVCEAARRRNITVWAVSFGSGVNTTSMANMRACASGDKAFHASNAAQLRVQFQAIAQQITRLRLSQ